MPSAYHPSLDCSQPGPQNVRHDENDLDCDELLYLRRDLTVRTPRGTPPVPDRPPGQICYVLSIFCLDVCETDSLGHVAGTLPGCEKHALPCQNPPRQSIDLRPTNDPWSRPGPLQGIINVPGHYAPNRLNQPYVSARMMNGQASNVTADVIEDEYVINRNDVSDELMSVVKSLTSSRRYVPQWYVYDTRGSEMCEDGGSSKTRLVIEAILKRRGRLTFVPVDMAKAADRFVLGLDMNTDRETLLQAYGKQWAPIWRDNLFDRFNKDFEGDMDAEKFEYNVDFVENPADGDTPSYVVKYLSSSGKQRVHFETLGLDIDFEDGENIYFYEGPNTSCKWNLGQVRRLVEKSGFAVDAYWTNDEGNYCVFCLEPTDICIGRESNPGLPRGRREFYH
ncbi:hypothetical protein Bbelb_350700 [Branchiostoma belcheri]|nr:hypothetical protein Bbelb_350700 [Branchiostoma belcheri]